MTAFIRYVRIHSIQEWKDLLDFINEVTKVDWWELADLFGAVDYSGCEEEVLYEDLSRIPGLYCIHIENTFDRMGDVIIRDVRRIPEVVEDADDVVKRYKAIRKVQEVDEKKYFEVCNILHKGRDDDPNRDELWKRIDELDPDKTLLEKHGVLRRMMHTVTGELSEFEDYTDFPAAKYFDY